MTFAASPAVIYTVLRYGYGNETAGLRTSAITYLKSDQSKNITRLTINDHP